VLVVLPGFLLGVFLHQLVNTIVLSLTNGLFVPDLGPLAAWYEMGWALTWWVTIFSVILGGLGSAVSSLIGALVYNLVAAITGGLIVETDLLHQSLPATPQTPSVGYATPAAFAPTVSPPLAPVAAPSSAGQPAEAVVACTRSGATGTDNAAYWLALRNQPAQRWAVRRPVTTLGAAVNCDIVLPGLAAHHAEIRFENNRYILYDLSSGNSWVNGRQITANMLKDGFTVRLDSTELIFTH
jgi:hypothetical protein